MFRKRNATSEKRPYREPGRVEAFSDAVFAIAITLMILELDVPAVEELESSSSLTQALVDLWPSYVGYLVSFLVIGILWINHHNVFKFFRGVDHWLLTINLVLLLCISFIPFPTALLAEHISNEEERTAALFYSLSFFVTSLVFFALWRYPTRYAPWLLEPGAKADVVASITRRYLMGPPAYLLAAAVSWFLPTVGLLILALIALLYLSPVVLGDTFEAGESAAD